MGGGWGNLMDAIIIDGKKQREPQYELRILQFFNLYTQYSLCVRLKYQSQGKKFVEFYQPR